VYIRKAESPDHQSGPSGFEEIQKICGGDEEGGTKLKCAFIPGGGKETAYPALVVVLRTAPLRMSSWKGGFGKGRTGGHVFQLEGLFEVGGYARAFSTHMVFASSIFETQRPAAHIPVWERYFGVEEGDFRDSKREEKE
jgi:hypothetical protein